MSFNVGYKSYINPPYFSGDYGAKIIDTDVRPNITIGRYCSIGKNLQFILNHHDYKHTSTHPLFSNQFARGHILIGNDVWIGLNVTIMDNVTIGDGAVIGAGAIVTKDVQAYAIIVGNPGHVVKYRFPTDIIDRLMRTKWWNYNEDELIRMGIKTKSTTEFLDTLDAL
jgi:carbonic anhydrase/acetyltransferase-like protein (isoleucine patch superfamily)